MADLNLRRPLRLAQIAGALSASGDVELAESGEDITIDLQATRTSGPTPLGVVLDATGTTAPGVSQVDEPQRQLYYEWDYGDSGAGTWATTGASRNTDAGGPIGAHVYDEGSEGSKTVTLTVTLGYPWLTAHKWLVDDFVTNGGDTYRCTTAHTSGSTTQPGVGASWATVWSLHASGIMPAIDTVSITVQDADTVYAGTATVCINGTGTDDGLGPSGCDYEASYPSPNVSDKRYLFKRGASYGGFTVARTTANVQVGAYGTGADPIFTSECRVCNDSAPSGVNFSFPQNIVVMDIEPTKELRQLITCTNLLVYRCTFDPDTDGNGMKLGRALSGANAYSDPANLQAGWSSNDFFRQTGIVISECYQRTASPYGQTDPAATLFGGFGERAAFIGNDYAAAPTSGQVIRMTQGYKVLFGNNLLNGPAGDDGLTHILKLHAAGIQSSQAWVWNGTPESRYIYVQSNHIGGSGNDVNYAVYFAPQTDGSPPGDTEQVRDCMAINNLFNPTGINGYELRFVGSNCGAYGNTMTSGSIRIGYVTDHSEGHGASVELTPYFGQGA